MHRLGERAIAGGIPDREANPLLSGGVKRHAELVTAQRRHLVHLNDLPACALSVSPDQFGELGWEGPFHLCGVEAARAGAFDAPVAEQYFTAGDEVIAGAQRLEDRGPSITELRNLI